MSDELLVTLGRAVRVRRERLGITREALAQRSGVSLRFLSDLEHGKGNISILRLIDIARSLGVSLADLVAPLDEFADLDQENVGPRIALVGLRGAGKSTIGAKVAEKLGVEFIELDSQIEKRAGLLLPQIFEFHGESYYRRIERESIKDWLKSRTPSVLAVAGGVVTDARSWSLLKKHARTVWLKADPEEHYRRVARQGDLRPMENRPQAMLELRALLIARSPRYGEADMIVDTSELSIEESAEKIVNWVSSNV